MNLVKGQIIRITKVNEREEFKNTTANSTLVYRVIRVNKKTYGLECIEGYMKGTRCNLLKDYPAASKDVYGTTTTCEVIE